MPHVDEGTLHAYLDGELPSTERAAVDAHLAQCATCRATLAEERALLERASSLLGSARPVERPAPPLEQLRRRSPKRSPWRVRTSFAWAASVFLALGLGYYLRDSGSLIGARQAPADLAHEGPVSTPVPPADALEERESRVVTRRESARSRRAETRADEVARNQALPAADSLVHLRGAAPGAVTLKSAAPTRLDTLSAKSPLMLDQVVVTAAPAPARDAQALQGRVSGRAVTAQWEIISRGDARTLLGTDPVGLPGLATRRIRRSPAPDSTVVVEQALDSSTVIEIFQRPAGTIGYYVDGAKLDTHARAQLQERARAPAAAAAREMAPADRLARFVGRLRVEIAGPLSLDSLNRLLEQVQPLP